MKSQRYWLLAVPLLLFTPQSRADLSASALEAFGSACGQWTFSVDLRKKLQELSAWNSETEQRIRQIGKFAKLTCPSYLNRANAESSVGEMASGDVAKITLPEFLQERDTMGTDTARTEEKGEILEAWFKEENAGFARLHHFVHDRSEAKPCSKAILGARKGIDQRISDMKSAVERIKVDCPGIAKIQEVEGRKQSVKRAADAPKAASAPTRKAASDPNAASDSRITGLELDARKRKQGQQLIEKKEEK